MKCRKLCMSDAVTIAISQVSRKISYQLTFCQHFPSKLDLKRMSSISDVPNFRAGSAKLQGSSQGYCKDGCCSGKQLIHLSSSTWLASHHHLSMQWNDDISFSLSLHCRDDIYTCASLDIKNMIYIYWHFLVYTAVYSLISLSTYSFSYPYIHLLIWTSIECLYAHMHMWNHMENE